MAITLAISVVVLSPLTHVLKVAHISSLPGAWLFYATLPLTVVLFALAGLESRPCATARLRILWLLLGVALVTALIRTDWADGTVEDIGGNLLRFLTPLTVIPVMARPIESAWITRIAAQTSLAKACFASSLLAVALTHWLARGGFNVYFGLQLSPAILVCLAVGLVTGSASGSIASLMLSIMAGKRGVVLAAVTVLASACLVHSSRRMGLIVSSCVLCVIATLYLATPGVVPAELANRVGGTLDSLHVAMESAGADEALGPLNAATQGRAEEVAAAVESLDSGGASAWLFGRGLGAAIITAHGEATDSTIHVSPVALTLLCGAPLAISVYMYAALIIAQTLISSAGRPYPGTQVLALLAAGEFVFSLSAFTFLHDPILWMCLAAAATRHGLPSASAARREARNG